jgi:hypothetical protein
MKPIPVIIFAVSSSWLILVSLKPLEWLLRRMFKDNVFFDFLQLLPNLPNPLGSPSIVEYWPLFLGICGLALAIVLQRIPKEESKKRGV